MTIFQNIFSPPSYRKNRSGVSETLGIQKNCSLNGPVELWNHNSFPHDDSDDDDADDEIEEQRKWEITGKSFDQKLLMRLWGV